MYFNGYFPINTNISIIAKINAVVEKLAGKISGNKYRQPKLPK
jgi:hypothetical protein